MPSLGSARLADRLQPTVDRLRQRLTGYGLRPYATYLVWTRWSGDERGEGTEREVARVPLLPNPKVDDLTRLSLSPYSGGTLPVGSVQLSRITTLITRENLMGTMVPGHAYFVSCGGMVQGRAPGPTIGQAGATLRERMLGELSSDPDRIPEQYEFFYELVEERPGAVRQKFRVFSEPFRKASDFNWVVILERISEDRGRDGRSRYGGA